MKHSVIGKVGALLLIAGTAFAVPTYAAEPTGQNGMKGGMDGLKGGMDE